MSLLDYLYWSLYTYMQKSFNNTALIFPIKNLICQTQTRNEIYRLDTSIFKVQSEVNKNIKYS